jgi:integrase/recombinase XerD
MVEEYITEQEKEYFYNGRKLPRLYREYLEYLKSDKGLSRGTIHNHKKPVLIFLTKLAGRSTPAGVKHLRPHHIHDYVTETAKPLTREGKKRLVTGLREFFRFLFLQDYTKKDLSKSVPTIVTYRMSRLHRGVPWKIVEELLRGPDRRTHRGRRDYAVILVLARYGVRSGQVVNLRLGDIDWKKKTIHFKAMKGGKDVLAPLLPDVVQALMAYFKGGRMKAPKKYDQVFLTTGTYGSYSDGQRPIGRALWYMVSRQLARIGYDRGKDTPRGPHSIRHAFATKLLEEKQPMKTIADLIGHESIKTTYVYAKSDMKMLKEIIVQWPITKEAA